MLDGGDEVVDAVPRTVARAAAVEAASPVSAFLCKVARGEASETEPVQLPPESSLPLVVGVVVPRSI